MQRGGPQHGQAIYHHKPSQLRTGGNEGRDNVDNLVWVKNSGKRRAATGPDVGRKWAEVGGSGRGRSPLSNEVRVLRSFWRFSIFSVGLGMMVVVAGGVFVVGEFFGN